MRETVDAVDLACVRAAEVVANERMFVTLLSYKEIQEI